MLSFGIEYERAFSIAFWSARLPPGSAPPSLAATMIARESLEKSLPRLASAAPFLCLMLDHLLCPDNCRLPCQLEKPLVNSRVVGQLGVERRHEDPAVAEQHRLAVELREDLDIRPVCPHARRADEDPPQRARVVFELEIGLEAGHLPPVRVAVDLDVGERKVRTVEDDHARARSEDRTVEAPDRVIQPVEPHQAGDR